MHISLTEKRTFTAEIPGRTLTDLQIESEWNGLTKFVQPASGLHLIVMRDEGLIVDGSKSLMDDLLASTAPTVEPGYVLVPGRTIEVGQYKIDVAPFITSQLLNCVVDGKATVSETAVPRVRISFADSKKVCAAVGGDVMHGSQHLALALEIMGVDANWSGGKVGEGILKRGLHRGTVSGAQRGDYVSPHADEDRWFLLSNGSRICDAAGHLFQYMHDDIHGGADGLTGNIPADSPYLVIAKQFSQAQGIGWRPDGARDWSGGALVRGGYWHSSGVAGVFGLGYVWPDYEGAGIGFRCTKSIGR